MDGRGVMTIAGLLVVLLVLGFWIVQRRRAARERPRSQATPDDGAGVPEPSIEDAAAAPTDR
jgi:cytoskeletal protein RodZ